MFDLDDEPTGFTRPIWRRIIRWPSVRGDARRLHRLSRGRGFGRLWARAAVSPGMRPAKD